ncbi:hypothetical protein LCGC14_0732150 [marine sediment metagenome]|uniref:Uncharacterized protein n=1 Tax=marine sediment metagenome TaxID=412755 RepID=A0A0F9QDF3_9ZZZZ
MGIGKLILLWLFILSLGIYILQELKNETAWMIFWIALGLYLLLILFKYIRMIED